MSIKVGLLSCLVGLGLSFNASASPLPYPSAGVENTATYAFKATSDGDVSGYFAGSEAYYDSTLSLLVNGVEASTGLPNHGSSIGQQFTFGSVKAGDSLVFKLNVLNTGDKLFSDAGMNSDNVNHVYSSAFSGDGTLPMGVFLAFEDKINGGDFDYNDARFVIANVSSVPVPAAIWLFGSALTGFVGLRQRKSTKLLVA